MDTHIKTARQARSGIEKVRRELLNLSPQAIERCAGPLQGAIDCMERLTAELAETRGATWIDQQALRVEVGTLQRDISFITALLRSAGSFYENYGRLLAGETQVSSADYSRAGKVASLLPQRKFVVHG